MRKTSIIAHIHRVWQKMQIRRAEQPVSIKRMVNAVEKVRNRLLRATNALENANIPYAVIGGIAVAALVSTVDESAVRNTQDVDLLIRRADLDRVSTALETAGFVHRHAAGIDMFLDGPEAKAREAVHIVFAEEKVRSDYSEAAPSVDDIELGNPFRVLSLGALVRMKLTSFRDKDRVHLRDLIDVKLLEESWCSDLPPALAERLKQLLVDPDG